MGNTSIQRRVPYAVDKDGKAEVTLFHSRLLYHCFSLGVTITLTTFLPSIPRLLRWQISLWFGPIGLFILVISLSRSCRMMKNSLWAGDYYRIVFYMLSKQIILARRRNNELHAFLVGLFMYGGWLSGNRRKPLCFIRAESRVPLPHLAPNPFNHSAIIALTLGNDFV